MKQVLDKIGTEQRAVCFDGKEHLTRVEDYTLALSGDTYSHRATIYNEGFTWWPDEKRWYKSINSDEELAKYTKLFAGTGITLSAKAVYRIIDADTNPIEY